MRFYYQCVLKLVSWCEPLMSNQNINTHTFEILIPLVPLYSFWFFLVFPINKKERQERKLQTFFPVSLDQTQIVNLRGKAH